MLIQTNVKKSSGRFKRYQLWWQPNVDPLSMELDMIRHGGQWEKKDGSGLAGEGLFFHYKKFQELAWPFKLWQRGAFKNHWAEECLNVYLKHQYIGAAGCASSGKSDSFGGNVLTDWYAHCTHTTVLVSSTDLKSLELRIWGMIKKYHRAAKDDHNWLPGHLIEGKQMLILDHRNEAEDGRDFKNGIIAVATKKGSQWVGLGPLIGIHNKRVRLLADECFPAGTMVDTPSGPRKIESIQPGELVIGAAGASAVTATSKKQSRSLAVIRTASGKKITCTPNHPFLTSKGWKKAFELGQGQFMLSAYESMLILQEGTPSPLLQILRSELSPGLGGGWQPGCGSEKKAAQGVRVLSRTHEEKLPEILQPIVQLSVDAQPAKHNRAAREEDVYFSQKVPSGTPGVFRAHVPHLNRQTVEQGGSSKPIGQDEGAGSPTFDSWRQWNRTNSSRGEAYGDIPHSHMEPSDQNRHEERKWLPDVLQGGRCFSTSEARDRSGWSQPQESCPPSDGREEGQILDGDWVDSVEIQESADIGVLGNDSGCYTVYNLQVAGHPSYSVEGLLVHNCNLMPRAFLDAAANLSKCEDFKLVGLGNPNETTNAHGMLCEPHPDLGGWEGGIDQTPGTKVWKTRFPNGVCIQLPGSDSPNMRAPEGEPPPFPFLITREQMENDAKIWGRDDWHYTMMNDAKMPRGQGSRRVLTRQSCQKFGAFKEPNWRDTRRTRIAFLDAAYRGVGGDRCVFGELQFGYEVEAPSPDGLITNLMTQSSDDKKGRQIIALIDLTTIPISSIQGADSPEDQIVKFVIEQCDGRGITPENFYYDAGMRTSLVQAFARNNWQQSNSIDCGGRPTEGQVSAEIKTPCRDYYSKFVTELWFSVRMAVESSQFRGMTEDACTEFCQREWKMVSGNKIEIESKDDMKLKTGRSPDLADAVAVGLFGARQKGFRIAKLADPEAPQSRTQRNWVNDLNKKAQKLRASGLLNHAA